MLPPVPPTSPHSGPRQVEIDGDGDPEGEEDVKNHGIDEEFSETEVFGRSGCEAVDRIGDGGGIPLMFSACGRVPKVAP